jgi:hypothetical protein
MSRWFRHYAGMMRDEKLVRVAIRSKQPIERVLWVWGAILESAAEIDQEGRYDLDAAEVAYFLRSDEADIAGIISALADAGRLAGDCVVNWGDRQFSSDKSKERQAAYRARKKAKKDGNDGEKIGGDGGVTSPDRRGDDDVTLQETETETELLEPNGSRASDDAPQVENDDVLKPEHVVEAWNDTAARIGLPKVIALNDPRRKRLRTMIRQHPPDDFARALDALERSPLCRGEKTDWRADFDFFLQTKSFTKLLEGAYG